MSVQEPPVTAGARDHRTVILAGACQPPGPRAALHFARAETRVIAMDRDAGGLAAISASCPGFIETLNAGNCDTIVLRHFAEAWENEPIDAVLNFLPLGRAADVNLQIAQTSALFRAIGRGLLAGHGVLITVVERPRDRLALRRHGLIGALSEVHRQWAEECADFGVRVHVVTVPHSAAALSLDTAIFLAGGPGVNSGRIDLTAP